MTQIIAFDLDGTLTESKQNIDRETALLINALSSKYKVIIITGGNWKQIKNQLLKHIKFYHPENIFLMPTSGAALYEWNGMWWSKRWEEKLSWKERNKIKKQFKYAIDYFRNTNFIKIGKLIEDRGCQITYSSIGQQAPYHTKKIWAEKKSNIKQKKDIALFMSIMLPEFSITLGGTTSIDITKKGIDKGYGISKIRRYLKASLDDFLFIGDRLEEGGNDNPIKKIGVKCIHTTGPTNTNKIIRKLLTKK